jgi:hypothetical protein
LQGRFLDYLLKTILPNMGTVSLETERKKVLSICVFIIILPFILLYWMAPFLADLTLGADYQLFSINEQLELLFSIKTGSFPLFVPGYKQGHSASALTLGQVYHPISHIASLLPGYWKGKSLEWNTFLRLLSLGIVHLVMFAFLRKIRISILFSFLLSLITVYNLRMLEAFRYGASLEAFTGNLLLCTLIGWYFISPSKWFGPMCITGSTYLLVCSGHPPMMFYGLVGAGLFTLIAPYFLSNIMSDRDVHFKIAIKFWTRVGSFMLLGILLSSAYVLPFYIEFVNTNIEYTKYPLEWSEGQETIAGALNNFFMPFVSDILGTFGGSSLIIIPLLLPLLIWARVKIAPSVWVTWGILLFAILYMLGPRTPLFRWAWEYFPLVSSVGGAGRISIIIPFFMMMLLVWVTRADSLSIRLNSMSSRFTPIILLGLIAMILIPLYLLPVSILKPGFGYFTPHFIRKIPFWIEFVSVFLGMASLAVLVVFRMYPQSSRILGVCLCVTVLLHVGALLKYGTFIEEKIDKPTFELMKVQKREKLYFHFYQNPGMYHSVVLNHLERTFVEPFLGKIYTHIISVEGRDDAYEQMEKYRLPQDLFIEGYSPDRSGIITEGAMDMREGTVDLIYSSYNRLNFRVHSEERAFLGLSYPYTGHWSAWINGEKVQVYRANGAAHAVEIPEGESNIEFRYWSDSFLWGIIISCTVLAIFGIYVCFRRLKGLQRFVGAVIFVVLSAGIFLLWYNSLYNGDNLETRYNWKYELPQKVPNLAYGKKTPSYYLDAGSMLRLYSGRSVDGNTEPDSGVVLRPSDEALIVSLGHLQEIERIVLYGDFKAQPEISLSQDGEDWREIAFDFSEEGNLSPLQIIFEMPESALFVKVRSVGLELGIDELEVYGRNSK